MTLQSPQQHVFRIFISYASEDLAIATAVATCFKTALPDFFAEVNLDKEFLEPGSAWQAQMEAKLQQTDVLVLVYSGVEKRSHSFTGWEVGYFDRILRTDSGHRKKISLYLYGPPATTASEQGIPLGLSKDQLQLSLQEFEAGLTVSPEEPLCKEIEDWQAQVEGNIESSGFARQHRRPEYEPAKCVRNLKLAIFQYLKGTVENVVKPQRQITIRVKGASLEQAADNLPIDALLRPMGPSTGGSMSIFGLADEPITWNEFTEQTANAPFADSWRQAITSVVLSAFPDRVDVDNSQHIVANDGKTGYRIILTTATKYYDGHYEYNLYFVELWRRMDYGDRDTTNLLKGLELVCRFRSMFLEKKSEFRGEIVGLTDPLKLQQVAASLLRELTLMHQDAQDAGIDRAALWTQYVDFGYIKAMAEAYRPAEARLRELIGKVMAAKRDVTPLESLRDEMAEVLKRMETAVRPQNALLLREMSAKLSKIVGRQEEENTVDLADQRGLGSAVSD
jgi:hypothetical protein